MQRFISPLHHGMTHPLRHSLYRAYLKNLRYIPDPHVWRTHQPYLRSLLDRPAGRLQDDHPVGESSASGQTAELAKEARRLRGLTRAREELKKLRAATACHPHALRRLLGEAYGQRGRVRWELINSIAKSDPSSTAQPPLPAPLIPLRPHRKVPPDNTNRLRPIPDVAIRKAAHRAWERDWRMVAVPLVLSPSARMKTGWEGLGVVEGLRILAGLDPPPLPIDIPPDPQDPSPPVNPTAPFHPLQPPRLLPRLLPSYQHLPPHIRLLIPKSHLPPPSRAEDDTYPRPRPGETRQNPKTWGPPRLLRARLIRRVYQRLWTSLRWVKCKEDGTWVEGKYGDIFGTEASGGGVELDKSARRRKSGR